MVAYASNPLFSVDEHLHYDEEEQLFLEVESKFEQTRGRLQKSRERNTRLLLADYLEKKQTQQNYRDLYDPDLGDNNPLVGR